MAGLPFIKMHGLGNDFVVIDARTRPFEANDERARAIADRKTGVGCDQLIVLEPPTDRDADVFMRIYNPDGSEAGACGNGTRCVAWAMLDDPEMSRASARAGSDRLTLETRAGLLAVVRVSAVDFTVDMGAPRLSWDEIPLAEPFPDTRRIELQIGPIDDPVLHSPGAVSMGNPHAVFFVDRDPDTYDLARIGPLLESHPIFPDRANISLARILDRSHIRLRVWERGAGITRACGTGACATLVASARRGLTERKATVVLDGGELGVFGRMHGGQTGCAPPARKASHAPQ